MSQILNKLRDVDPNNSDAVKEALSPFFQQLTKHTEVDCIHWLRALENAINRFPKYCMSQRDNIEKYLINFLDCTNYYIVIEAAKCAHVLQQVRPSQEKTATAKSCWRDQLASLCEAAHKLITTLFPNAVDIYEHKIHESSQDTSSPFTSTLSRLHIPANAIQNNNVLNKQAVMNIRLRNVFIFIQAMFIERYPVAKPIRPQLVLDVIVRALSLSSSTKSDQTLADVGAIKTQALRTLDALVICLGPNLIPFSPLVFRFVMQTLKWSSDNPSDEASKVRCVAYASLGRWLSTLHCHRLAQDRGRNTEDELAEHILTDITPHRHVVELKMNSQPTKHLSKKAKRKLANTMLQESNLASHMPGEKNKVPLSEEVNDEVAIAALKCAEILFTVCGIFLKPSTHKRFQERLVRECYSLHQYSKGRGLALLGAVEASRRGPPPSLPPPTQYCMQIYTAALRSPHAEISNFCSQALLNIRLHLHCSPPSLNFAIEVDPREETRKEEEKKKISEKNRAALEALLGADKVPKQNGQEEVITIADEPSNKRRKLDDSDTAHQDQIEISDDSDDSSVEINEGDNNDDASSENPEVEIVIEDIETNVEENVEEVNIEPVIEEAESVADAETENIVQSDIHEKETELRNDVIEENDVTDSTDVSKVSVENICLHKEISEDKVDSTSTEHHHSIYEIQTQMPVNTSHEDEDETPLSMEVAYDYPNTGTEKITVLEKLDGDNLPSTNDTDDIEITCGQDLKTSPDKKVEEKVVETKVNGIDSSEEKPLQNGDLSESVNAKEVNVEDMLADFVDEVNEDAESTQMTAEA